MSVQLILYPQNYEGISNSISTANFFQYVSDGENFYGLASAAFNGTTASNWIEDILQTYPATTPNVWYRYKTTGGSWGVPPIWPVGSGGVAIMISPNSPFLEGRSGFYQRMTGLTPGNLYTVEISATLLIPESPAYQTLLFCDTFDGDGSSTTYLSQSAFSPTQSSAYQTFNTSFVANSSDATIVIDWGWDETQYCYVNYVRVTEDVSNPVLTYGNLEDGQVICDQYEEEDIPLTLSVDEFTNVAEKVQSYSKDFNLPATKRNNQIFDHIFEITRSVAPRHTQADLQFNPYKKTKALLKQDSFILFEGYLRLISIQNREGEISYNVNLYSDVIALKDTLKEKKFADLDFNELAHIYNKTNIKNSWYNSTGLQVSNSFLNQYSFLYDPAIGNYTHTNVLKYPYVNWTGEFVAASSGFPLLDNLEQAFRPWIQARYLLRKIFASAGFTYTSNFFDSEPFTKMFVDFNWGAENSPANFSVNGVVMYWYDAPTNWAPSLSWGNLKFSLANTMPAEAGYDDTTGEFTCLNDNTSYTITYDIWLQGNALGTGYIRWKQTGAPTINPSSVISFFDGSYYNYSGTFTTTLNSGDKLWCEFYGSGSNIFKQFELINLPFQVEISSISAQVSVSTIVSGTLMNTLRGEIGQWDFLKGLMTMFNLISLPDKENPNNIFIEPYEEVFGIETSGTSLGDRSVQHDWTEKVDIADIKLKPLNLKKYTNFKFVEDEEDYPFRNFKQATGGHLYGSLEWSASALTLLDGEEDIEAKPFAATIIKPLADTLTSFIVPAIYGSNDNATEFEGIENVPRILYNTGLKYTGSTYYIPAQNGLSSENQPYYLQFSHLSQISTTSSTLDFNFETSQTFNPIGAPPIDNLFNVYWAPYYNELYNSDSKTMEIKVNLTASDIAAFSFYDRVFIQNRTYRVNKIQYKPGELSKVEFILIT